MIEYETLATPPPVGVDVAIRFPLTSVATKELVIEGIVTEENDGVVVTEMVFVEMTIFVPAVKEVEATGMGNVEEVRNPISLENWEIKSEAKSRYMFPVELVILSVEDGEENVNVGPWTPFMVVVGVLPPHVEVANVPSVPMVIHGSPEEPRETKATVPEAVKFALAVVVAFSPVPTTA